MPGLLNQDPTGAQPPVQPDVPPAQPMQPGVEQPPEDATLTISAEQVGSEIMKGLDKNQQQAVKQIVNAGMKVLFGKESHDTIFDSIRPEDEVPLADELGVGATNLMLMMFEQSKGSMPPDAIVPAGAILLAKAVEFIAESEMAPVTDADFSEAFELFTVNIQDKLDPSFRESHGLQPGGEAPGAPPIAGGGGAAPAQPGILNQGGA